MDPVNCFCFFLLSFFFYRYPNISCELLTSDVSQINDRLVEDEKLLVKLYGFLQNQPPLNPLLASFFSKVLSILIGRKPEQVSIWENDEMGVVTERRGPTECHGVSFLCLDRGVSPEEGGLCRPDDHTHRDLSHHGPASQNAHLHWTTAVATGCP